MNIRTRRFTSLILAGAILAGGAGGIGATSALAHDNGGASSAQRHQRDGHRGAPPAVTAAVKQVLNVDDAALKAARTSGTSLTALAKQKGVDRDTLVAAIASAMKASKPANAPALTDAQLTARAGKIADQVPGAPRGERNDAGRKAVHQAIASALGMTTAELKAAHKAGTSPATLAQQKGVARDTLVAAVTSALKANKPADAPALTDGQLTEMAGDIVDGTHAPKGPGGPGGRGGHRR